LAKRQLSSMCALSNLDCRKSKIHTVGNPFVADLVVCRFVAHHELATPIKPRRHFPRAFLVKRDKKLNEMLNFLYRTSPTCF